MKLLFDTNNLLIFPMYQLTKLVQFGAKIVLLLLDELVEIQGVKTYSRVYVRKDDGSEFLLESIGPSGNMVVAERLEPTLRNVFDHLHFVGRWIIAKQHFSRIACQPVQSSRELAGWFTGLSAKPIFFQK